MARRRVGLNVKRVPVVATGRLTGRSGQRLECSAPCVQAVRNGGATPGVPSLPVCGRTQHAERRTLPEPITAMAGAGCPRIRA